MKHYIPIPLLLACGLTALMLSACGGSDTTTNSDGGTHTESTSNDTDNQNSDTTDHTAESDNDSTTSDTQTDSSSDDNDTDSSTSTSTSSNNTPVNTTDNNPTVSPSGTLIADGARLLAAQCFQCHGTNGRSQTGIDSLLGESEAELIEEMREMKAESDNKLMHFQARGYNDAQIRAIAAYIAALPNSGGNTNEGGSDND